ncbi:MAG TPA: hypothetical protein VFA09_13520 [Ktedonobacteraceae bacterium]|nr:hypothetical protein [Ktedonobacteraceae bacterium]
MRATAPISGLWNVQNETPKHILTGGRRKLPVIMLVLFLLVLLCGCSGGNAAPVASTTPTAPARPTPTSLPAGTLLYQSDWSHGLDGWQSTGGWKLMHGMLQSDVGAGEILTSPYMPVVPNYAIEVRYQIISTPVNGGNFAVVADKAPQKDGYTAGILDFHGPAPHSEFSNPEVLVFLNPIDAAGSRPQISDYESSPGVHTYRIEVQGPEIQFFIDQERKSSATSSQTDFLSNGPIHVRVDKAIIRVFSVRITAL